MYVLVLHRSVKTPKEKSEFPQMNVPVLMDNCSCPMPCSFIGYKTEMRTFAKYNIMGVLCDVVIILILIPI